MPATLVIIFLLLYATFRRLDEAALVMGTLPFALTGGVWLLYLLGYTSRSRPGSGSSRSPGCPPSSAWSC